MERPVLDPYELRDMGLLVSNCPSITPEEVMNSLLWFRLQFMELNEERMMSVMMRS